MGTSTSAAEFSGKLARMTAEVAKLPAVAARQNAATISKVMGAAVSQMSGGDGRLSRVGGGRGASVGVSTAVRDGRVDVSPRGPVGLVENPIGPHEIGSGGQRLRLRGRWVTGPVLHPGTRGKGEWQRSRDRLIEPVRTEIAGEMTAAATRSFG